MKLVECQNVSFAYGDNLVLSDVNFAIHKGDYLAILGENGSGKSTLVKGILKSKEVYSGIINFHESLKDNEIGYLPQKKTMIKDFPASVFEVVLSGRINRMGLRPFYTKKDKAIAMENLEKMGILHLKNKSFSELSGGQHQRVLLARGLSSTKKVFVLDEPVAGLDPVATGELYELIKKLNELDGMTIIMVTHDIEAALSHSSHILHLGDKQLFYGRTEAYKKMNLLKEYAKGGQNG